MLFYILLHAVTQYCIQLLSVSCRRVFNSPQIAVIVLLRDILNIDISSTYAEVLYNHIMIIPIQINSKLIAQNRRKRHFRGVLLLKILDQLRRTPRTLLQCSSNRAFSSRMFCTLNPPPLPISICSYTSAYINFRIVNGTCSKAKRKRHMLQG